MELPLNESIFTYYTWNFILAVSHGSEAMPLLGNIGCIS